MTLDWLYKLGDWNPQFFREFKGRLQPRSLSTTVMASLAIQTLILGYFWLALPGNDTSTNLYCTGSAQYSAPSCIRDTAGNVLIDWPLWWLHLFQFLSWALPFIVLISGVYMLISDLGKEDRRGTLNFIRLSPQSSQSVLLGKLLGVPIVPFLAVALAIPLHLIAALSAGVSAKIVLTIYVLTTALAGTYFTGALVFAFLGGLQGWIGAIFVWFSFMFFFQLWWAFRNYGSQILLPHYFLSVPVGKSLGLTLAFWVVTLSVTTFWLWQVVNRRYRNPIATILSKRQSYLMTASVELWLLGFVFRERSQYEGFLDDLGIIGFVNLIWFVMLMASLMPQRQALLDWARYRHERIGHPQKLWNRPAIKDLVWGEKSPAVLAIGVNLLVVVAIFLPWIATWNKPDQQLQALAAIALGCTYVLICAVITQLVMLLKSSRRNVLATAIVGGISFIPPILLSMLSFYPAQIPIAWLFSAFPLVALNHATAMEICLSFLAHVGLLTTLSLQLHHRLKKAGESEMKALMSSGTWE